MCGPLAVNVFLLGAAVNLRIFKRHNLAIDKIFGMRRDEVPTAEGVGLFGLTLLAVQMTLFGLKVYRDGASDERTNTKAALHNNAAGDDAEADDIGMESLLVVYCGVALLLLLCPLDVLHRKCRFFLLRKLGACVLFWPSKNAACVRWLSSCR